MYEMVSNEMVPDPSMGAARINFYLFIKAFVSHLYKAWLSENSCF